MITQYKLERQAYSFTHITISLKSSGILDHFHFLYITNEQALASVPDASHITSEQV